MPNTNQIKNDLGKSSDTIKEIFERNTHFFKRQNGLPTTPTDEFMYFCNLYQEKKAKEYEAIS